MDREIKLNELRDLTDSLSYPLSKAEAVAAVDDVVLRYADGQEPLPAVIERSTVDVYDSPEDLESAVFTHVPTEAVGEPGQSEGEG